MSTNPFAAATTIDTNSGVSTIAEPRVRPAAIWLDVSLACVVAVVAAAAAWGLYDYFDPLRIGGEQWFQSDIYRVWVVLTDRYSGEHERSRIHPLFSLICSTFVYALRWIFSLDKVTAVQVWISLTAGALFGLVYATGRLLRFTRPDSLVICALVLSSASALFWVPVPETKTVGAISILLCVVAAVLHEKRPLPDWVLVGVAAISLSMTVSNFMAGLAFLVVTRPFRKAAQLAVNAFFVVSVLQIVQNFVYWHTTGMAAFRSETRFLFDRSAGTMLDKLVVSLSHSMVLPVMQTPIEFDSHSPMMSIQTSPLGSSGAIEAAAVVLWVVALAWGSRQLWKMADGSAALKTIGLTAIGQVLFHLVYGDQTFLYTLHFLPLLVLTAGLVVKSSRPYWGRLLLWTLLVVCVVNNARNLADARQVLDRIRCTVLTPSESAALPFPSVKPLEPCRTAPQPSVAETVR